MHPSATPSVYFRLSLLGHQLLDVLTGARKSALTQAPVLRYVLVGTLALAVAQATTQDTGAEHVSRDADVVAAGLFGASAPAAVTSYTAEDLDAVRAYTPTIARYSREFGLDRSALAATTLLSARAGATTSVQKLARALQAAAVNEDAATPAGWVTAAATLFDDPTAAKRDLRFLIQRYSL